jgi:hypothetical protein
MNTVFGIMPSSSDPETCVLICEVSNEGFSCCIRNEDEKSYVGVAIYHFDSTKPAIGFPIALQVLFHQHDIFSKKFRKVCVGFSFPQSVLIPFSMYDRDKNQTLMNLMFGDLETNDVILTDIISEQSLYNTYRLSAATVEMIKNQFPDATMTHQYSLLLKNFSGDTDSISVIFYTQKVVVHVFSGGKHFLLNSFDFTTANDISFILLNICQQLKIKKIHLVLRGLVEENSALYNEIYKYFDDIEFASFRKEYSYSEEIAKFPSHYFSHIFDIDSCE